MDDEFYQTIEQSLQYALNRAGNYLSSGIKGAGTQEVEYASIVFTRLAYVLQRVGKAKAFRNSDRFVSDLFAEEALVECENLRKRESADDDLYVGRD